MSSSPVSKMSTAWQVEGLRPWVSEGAVGREPDSQPNFEEQLAIQLEAAQESLKHSHEQVLLFVSRQLSSEVEWSARMEAKVKTIETQELPELLTVVPAPPTSAPPLIITPPGEVLHEEEVDRGRGNTKELVVPSDPVSAVTQLVIPSDPVSAVSALSTQLMVPADGFEVGHKLSQNAMAAHRAAQSRDYLAVEPKAPVGSASMISLQGRPHASMLMNFKDSNSIEGALADATCSRQLENGKFAVLPVWLTKNATNAKSKSAKKPRNFALIRAATTSFLQEDDTISQNRYLSQHRWLQRLIANPNSLHRVVWDLFSIALVAYDMVVIPLQMFEPPDSGFSIAMSWVTRIFWTLDLCFSPLTGHFNSDGTIEMRPEKVVSRYFKTWFVVDFTLVFFDWWEILWTGGSDFGYFRVGKASRTFRIIRMARLLRIVRIRRVIQQLAERIQSEWLIIMADLVKILLAILSLAHVIACLWWGIGISNSGGWVEESGLGTDNSEGDLGYRYSTSLHWSVSQFTGGMDEVRPHTVFERVYAIVVFLMGFMMAALFVSSLTSSMTQLHILTSHQSRQLAVLRRYLSHNGISDRLALRVQRNAQHAMAEKQRHMPESGVDLLRIVSDPLRVELHFELFSPTLKVHPFFADYIEECPQVMCKVCHKATSISLESPGDVLFHAGEILPQPKMYIVIEGTLEYVPIAGKCATLGAGAWISEASLWTTWIHRGVMTATNDCRLLCIDAKEFQTIASRFDHTDFDPKEHASAFVRRLNIDADVDDLFGMCDHLEMQTTKDGKVWWSATLSRFNFKKSRRAKLLQG